MPPKNPCCILDICCRAHEKKVKALVSEINDCADHDEIAERLLAKFDLVPKGLGVAIADFYRPFFKDTAEE